MITRFFPLAISITLLLSCTLFHDKSRGIIVKRNIPDNISNRLIELELINKSDTVLGLFYHISDEPNSIVEDYTFFTKDKLLRYFQFGDSIAEISVAPFNKTLNIKKDVDSKYKRIEINTWILDTILYNKYEQRDKIYYNNEYFYCNYGTHSSKQKKFYELLKETWRNNTNIQYLTELNDKYFDEEGQRKVTPDKKIERDMIQSIKNRLMELSIDVIDEDYYLVINYDNSIFRITYYFYSKEYTILKFNVNPMPSDESELKSIVAAYPIHKLDEIDFPYSERGITYNEVTLSKEKSKDEIIDKYFKE